MLTTIPKQDAGHLDQPQVVGGLLLVTNQESPALREPAQSALHYPPPRRVALLSFRLLQLFLADAPNVGHIPMLRHDFTRHPIVVTLVQAQVLGRLLGRTWALDHYG